MDVKAIFELHFSYVFSVGASVCNSEESKCGACRVGGGKPFLQGSSVHIQYICLVPGILPRSAQWDATVPPL